MALTVTTPATDTNLVDIDVVKDELGITVNTYDSQIDRLIDQVSRVIEEWCGRGFIKQTYRETLPGHGGTTLMLAVTPVISITEITYDGSVIDATGYSLQEPVEGFVYRGTGWSWTARLHQDIGSWPYPGSEEFLYQVDYIAGYDPPTALIPTIPGSVERAAIITVKDWYLNKGRNPTLKGLKVADAEFEYDIESDMPPQAIRLLSKYRVAE